MELEAQKKELEDRERELKKRKAQNESERRKIFNEKKMVQYQYCLSHNIAYWLGLFIMC